MRSLYITGVISLLVMQAIVTQAQSTTERGYAIAAEADRREQGFVDSIAEMEMILSNQYGDKSTRRVTVKTLEVDGDGDKSLSIFEQPADVKGTVFLTYSHSQRSDDQWLYLPALKRVKRISSKNKSGPFMGSEFAYEDISSQELDKYTYKYIADDQYKDHAVFILERYPVYENSGYTKQIVWMDKKRYIPLKVEFYDRKDALLKTLDINEYKQYLNQYWRAHYMHMENHQTGKSTLLKWSDYQFRTGLNTSDFRQTSLKHAR